MRKKKRPNSCLSKAEKYHGDSDAGEKRVKTPHDVMVTTSALNIDCIQCDALLHIKPGQKNVGCPSCHVAFNLENRNKIGAIAKNDAGVYYCIFLEDEPESSRAMVPSTSVNEQAYPDNGADFPCGMKDIVLSDEPESSRAMVPSTSVNKQACTDNGADLPCGMKDMVLSDGLDSSRAVVPSTNGLVCSENNSEFRSGMEDMNMSDGPESSRAMVRITTKHTWPRNAEELRRGVNDTFLCFQTANYPNIMTIAEWKHARSALWQTQQEVIASIESSSGSVSMVNTGSLSTQLTSQNNGSSDRVMTSSSNQATQTDLVSSTTCARQSSPTAAKNKQIVIDSDSDDDVVFVSASSKALTFQHHVAYFTIKTTMSYYDKIKFPECVHTCILEVVGCIAKLKSMQILDVVYADNCGLFSLKSFSLTQHRQKDDGKEICLQTKFSELKKIVNDIIAPVLSEFKSNANYDTGVAALQFFCVSDEDAQTGHEIVPSEYALIFLLLRIVGIKFQLGANFASVHGEFDSVLASRFH